MGKRSRPEEPAQDTSRPPKRPRPQQSYEAPVTEVVTARDLHNVLVFAQDEARSLQSIASLKVFLNSILHPEDEDAVPRQRAILREYLATQQPRETGEEAEYLPSLMQTWNFAGTSNSDRLLSATISVVDQLLKVLSNHIDFREYGLQLCKTILQQPQLRILSRGLASPKNKEHIISPCLRVLKEVVSFDGGTLARQLYAKRDLAFEPNLVARCLTNRRINVEGPEDIVQKPSVRTTAVRYVLANFKFQDDGAKADMLKQGNVMRTLVDGIEGDHSRIVREVLQSLKRDVIDDLAIPKRNKSFLFNERNLQSLCQLYRASRREDEDAVSERRPLLEVAHEFIVIACTSPDVGVVRASGWYPPTGDEDALEPQKDTDSGIDLGLDGIAYYNKFNKTIPIRNIALSELILHLRPYAYDYERLLLLAIMEAAPELVAWFYRKMATSFLFTPKLTATWIGYAATLFETVRLPLPIMYARMGHLPPSVTIMIESILPAPLDRKTLRQCLTNSAELVRFFAVRILIASFHKLRNALAMLKAQASNHGKLWDEAATKVIEEFCRRCPTLSDVTKLYAELRKGSGDKSMQQEAVLRLVALFCEVIPQVALNEGYDVSIPLTNALQAVEETELEGEEAQLRLIELGHLVKIAAWAPSIHWWSKPKGSKFSPIVTLLRLLVRDPTGSVSDIKALVQGIMNDTSAIQLDTSPTGLDALIFSLQGRNGHRLPDAVFEFLDNCLSRFSKRPIKYEDDKDASLAIINRQELTAKSCSLVVFTIIEQYGFIQASGEDDAAINLWIRDFLTLLQVVGERYVETINRDQFKPKNMSEQAFTEKCAPLSFNSATQLLAGTRPTSAPQQLDGIAEPQMSGTPSPTSTSYIDICAFQPPASTENNPVLIRYRKKDLTSLVEDGDMCLLIQLISSSYLSIRTQATDALRSMLSRLETSTHAEKDVLYLVLGEFLETTREVTESAKIPSALITTFAAKAVGVVKDPTHALYIKVNELLNKGPSWRVRQMPAFWLEQVLQHPPGDADTEGSYWREVIWVLEWLFDGLQTRDDFDILRRNSVFEKIMALFFHPSLTRGKFIDLVVHAEKLKKEASLQAQVRPMIMKLVTRAALVGGATILITGSGVIAWLRDIKNLVRSSADDFKVVDAIENLILEQADSHKLQEWSGGGLGMGHEAHTINGNYVDS